MLMMRYVIIYTMIFVSISLYGAEEQRTKATEDQRSVYYALPQRKQVQDIVRFATEQSVLKGQLKSRFALIKHIVESSRNGKHFTRFTHWRHLYDVLSAVNQDDLLTACQTAIENIRSDLNTLAQPKPVVTLTSCDLIIKEARRARKQSKKCEINGAALENLALTARHAIQMSNCLAIIGLLNTIKENLIQENAKKKR